MQNYQYMNTKQIISCGKYSFTMGQLRQLLLYRDSNGLNICIRKVGKTLLFRMDLFEKWIEEHK
jgi:hypothetical protein